MTITFRNGSTITPIEGEDAIRSKPRYSCAVCGKKMFFVRYISDDGDPVCEDCWDDYCSHFEDQID